ncbi:unnamed protein product [Eruca vesicaria subsp. sativa]|uniref:RRM domain-containing protein n=1 Tax=Eruca vesicaria subsp. sativa TaxID=29727 RepID=A0ABC8KUR7_ERUVS|nr:unnamed protein product [Eruca vesicaria subsp. sativa]
MYGNHPIIQQLAHGAAQRLPNQQFSARNYNGPPLTQHQPEEFHDICVENLDSDVTRDMLRHSFRRYPSVREVKIQNVTGRDQKRGFVSFADESERKRAMQEMNGAKLLNKPMKIRDEAHGSI